MSLRPYLMPILFVVSTIGFLVAHFGGRLARVLVGGVMLPATGLVLAGEVITLALIWWMGRS